MIIYFDLHCFKEFRMISLAKHLRVCERLIGCCVGVNLMTEQIDRIVEEAIDLFKVICYSGHKGKMLMFGMRIEVAKFHRVPTELKTERKDKPNFSLVIRCDLSGFVELV